MPGDLQSGFGGRTASQRVLTVLPLAQAEARRMGFTFDKAAAGALALNANVEFQVIACMALGLYLYAHARPHRFPNDQGLRFQLVRKVRGLDELSVGKH